METRLFDLIAKIHTISHALNYLCRHLNRADKKLKGLMFGVLMHELTILKKPESAQILCTRALRICGFHNTVSEAV